MQLKNYIKLLCSTFALFFLACSISPTYSRKDTDKVIKNICKDEFGIAFNTWITGDTIWVYAPFTELMKEGKQQPRKKPPYQINDLDFNISGNHFKVTMDVEIISEEKRRSKEGAASGELGEGERV